MKTKYWYIFIILILAGMFSSCEEKIEQGELPRLFRPTAKTAVIKNNSILVRWNANVEAAGYTIDMALSSDTTAVIQTVTTDTIEYLFADLQEETSYHFSVKAVSPLKEELNSKAIYITAVSGRMPSYFLPTSNEYIGTSFITVRWKNPDGDLVIDALEVSELENPGAVINHTLTPEEIANMSAKITGLTSQTDYLFKLKLGNSVKSKTRIKTAFVPTDVQIVEPTGDLKAVVEAANDGATIMLRGGQLYDYSTTDVKILKSITIMGEPGMPKPKFYGWFRIAGVVTSNIDFGDVTIKGLEASGMKFVTGTTNEDIAAVPNFRFIGFDPANATPKWVVTMNKLTVEDCYIRNYTYTTIQVREQALHLDELNIDNCIVYDIGRSAGRYQGLLHLSSGNNNVACHRINILNSTFVQSFVGLIELQRYRDQPDTDPNIHKIESINVENCTFDKYGKKLDKDGWYWSTAWTPTTVTNFIRLQFHSQVPMTFKNCVFGEMSTALSINTTVSDGAAVTYISTVKSKDCSIGFTATDCGTDANGLFEDREAFNYRIKSSFGYVGVGDPRWE